MKNTPKKKTKAPLIVRDLQNLIIPRYIESMCNNRQFRKELDTYERKGEIKAGTKKEKIQYLKDQFRSKYWGHELAPLPPIIYSLGLKSSGLLSVSFASNLHLLTVVSYDSVIFEMLQNLAVGNFSKQNLYPQKEGVNKVIDYSSNVFSLRLSRTISSLVEILHDHLTFDLDVKPKVSKIRQMFFIHFLREILPVLLRLGNHPVIDENGMKFLRQAKKKMPKFSVDESTCVDQLLFGFQRLFKMGFEGLTNSGLKMQWEKKHKEGTYNSITTRGVFNLEFKDIHYSKKNDHNLPSHFKEFVEDMIYNRKTETYDCVIFKGGGLQYIPDSSQAQINTSKKNPESMEDSTTQPTEENQLENSDEMVPESKTSKTKSSRKRTSASSKEVPNSIVEKIYTRSKKFKHLMIDIQDSEKIPDEVKMKIDSANGAFDNLFTSIHELYKCMGSENGKESVQNESEDDDTKSL